MTILSTIGGGSIYGFGYTKGASGLYEFTTFTFTTAGGAGVNGPILAQLQSSYSATAWAQNTSFLNIGSYQGYQKWTVPYSGNYIIEAGGGRGGGDKTNSLASINSAYIKGTFTLTKGDYLEIVVGQNGGYAADPQGNESGGGGGTFVKNITTSTLLLVAGGSGGAPSSSYGTSCTRDVNIGYGQAGNASTCSACYPYVSPPSNGYGGNSTGSYNGGAGGGYLSVGANGGTHCALAYGGGYYGNGLVGGTGNSCYTSDNAGGFGGGGGGQLGSPGGAGGYSGGSVTGQWSSYSDYGGGGGSYNVGSSQTNTTGGATSGYCKITRV